MSKLWLPAPLKYCLPIIICVMLMPIVHVFMPPWDIATHAFTNQIKLLY